MSVARSREDPDALVGRTFGEFVVREHLSSGGFGAVFRAEQPALGREAVIKVLHARLMKSDSTVQRFLREARLASLLDHPYAAHTYAFGVEPDGTLWIAMELVRGTPLDRLLAAGPIPLERFVPLLERICEVVQTAHEQGIVHRDLKPANVMVLARAGRLLPKLLDFGIAKIADEEVAAELASRTTLPPVTPPPAAVTTEVTAPPSDTLDGAALDATVIKPRRGDSAADPRDTVTDPAARLTQVGTVMGSPYYMAPEQWSDSGTVSSRSDIYALGVLAYEALTGRPPFTGPDVLHLAIAHSAQSVPRLGPGFAPELDEVVARALSKRPEDRFETALDLAAAFRAASGIAADRASLPRLDPALCAAVLTDAPRPIALAVGAFATARNAHQARDALWRAVHTITRTVSLIAVASHAHIASEETARDEAVGEALRALRRGGLSDAGWLELARGLVRPFARYPEVHPIPALVELLAGAGPDPLAELLELKGGADEGGGADEEEVIALLEDALPHLAALLERLAFLRDYRVVVPLEGGAQGEDWAGASAERPRRPIAGRALQPGRPLLLDRDGAPVVVLWPFFQVCEPVPGTPPQLFLFDGRGRRGARLVALPEAFERGDDELWDALGSLLGGDDDNAGAITMEEVCPFPGLAAFTADDAESFTGREREVEAFVNRLLGSPLLAVVGPSGAGKSSFIQAGVVAALPGDWDVITVRPGLSPVAALVTRVAAAGIDATTLARDLEQHPGALGSALRAAAAARGRRILLVIDQLEELFTLSDDERERELFAGAVARAARSPDDPVRVVLTLRDDFLLRAEALAALRARLAPALQLLTTPAPADLHRILVEPLRRAGYVFDDPGLPDEIVEELHGAPGALALLSFTASKLWELRDRKFRQIHHKAYRSLGGVGGALAQHAEATLAELPQEEKRLVREVFRHAVTAEGTRAVLRGDELAELLGGGSSPADQGKESAGMTNLAGSARARAVVDKLIAARLLVGAEAEGGGEQIEITHEALLSAWPRLVAWRREDAEGARLRDQLRAAARQWDERGRPSGLLWRGDALAEYRLWRARTPGGLTAAEEAFAAASLADAARGRRLRRIALSGLIAGLAAVAVVLLVQNQRVQRERGAARQSAAELQTLLVNQYESQGQRLRLADDPLQALAYFKKAADLGAAGPAHDFVVALAARSTDGQIHVLANNALVVRARFSPDGTRVLTGADDGNGRIWDAASGAMLHRLAHDAAVVRVDWSPDGTRCATGSFDGTVAVWDAATGTRLHVLAHETRPDAILFSPDGARIATVTTRDAVRLWDAATGTLIAQLHAPADDDGEMMSVPAGFSADGAWLAAGARDGAVRLWRVRDGSPGPMLTTPHRPVSSVQFFPDGERVAVAGGISEASVYAVASGKRLRTLPHAGEVLLATVSPDGRFVATASRDRSAIVWDAATGAPTGVVVRHGAGVNQVTFTADSARLATASDDGTAQLWDVATGRRLARRIGHRGDVRDVGFDRDGRRMVTASFDTSARIWSTEPNEAVRPLSRDAAAVLATAFAPGRSHILTAGGDAARIRDVATTRALLELPHAQIESARYSRDGARVATVGSDGIVRIWNAASGALVREMRGHTAPVRNVDWSRDGSLVASASDDGSVRVWDPESGEVVRVLGEHGGQVFAVAFSPTASLVATGGVDNIVHLWEPRSGRELRTLSVPEGLATNVAFDPTGRWIALGAVNGTTRIASVETGATRVELIGHRGIVLHVDWSPDGNLVVTCGPDGPARLWDAATGSLLALLPVAEDTHAQSAGFAADGGSIAIGREDGVTDLHELPGAESARLDLDRLIRCRVPFEVAADRLLVRDVDPSACTGLRNRR